MRILKIKVSGNNFLMIFSDLVIYSAKTEFPISMYSVYHLIKAKIRAEIVCLCMVNNWRSILILEAIIRSTAEVTY